MITTASAAGFISLVRFGSEMLDRYNKGEMTEAELDAAWDALQISRDDTKGIWADAKRIGGYE